MGDMRLPTIIASTVTALALSACVPAGPGVLNLSDVGSSSCLPGESCNDDPAPTTTVECHIGESCSDPAPTTTVECHIGESCSATCEVGESCD